MTDEQQPDGTMNATESDAVKALLMLAEYDGETECDAMVVDNVDYDGGVSSDDDSKTETAYSDDGLNDYYEARLNDTLVGWTYSLHPRSICLTPPDAWYTTPSYINVQWYKRPLFFSDVHKGYFLSNSQVFVDRVEELGAVYDQDRVW